jgi:hypothetical protein
MEEGEVPAFEPFHRHAFGDFTVDRTVVDEGDKLSDMLAGDFEVQRVLPISFKRPGNSTVSQTASDFPLSIFLGRLQNSRRVFCH